MKKNNALHLSGRKPNSNVMTVTLVALAYIVISVLLYTGNISRQFSNMLIPISVYIVLAVSLNLVVGLLGELSLGHACFMSMGLFSGCLISIALCDILPAPIRIPVSMLAGALFAAILGFIVGLPALRLKGDYLAIVTLACGEIVKNIITNLPLTGGALGLDTKDIYSKPVQLIPYAGVLVLLTVVVMMNLKKSRHGRAIMALRDNRIAAESVGVNVTKFKLMAFVLAAALAGAAGVLYGHSLANIKAVTFDYNMSIEILVIVVLGGMGSVPGSIIAAVVLQLLPELLRDFSDYRMLLYAIVLILVMLVTNNPILKAYTEKAKAAISGIFKKVFSKKQKGAM